MIKIVFKSKLKPDILEEYLKIITELITETRKEDGCISYDLFEDVKDPLILTLIEEWRDEEAIERHNNTGHFTRIVPELRKFREYGEMNLYKKLPY
ncbi:MAG: putative quinol monooxygenase [Clostridia bacterium]|jgi:quinol monooxygenase YgiN|nr:putative quinol monooxygenase [Clostridia bacterium]